MIRFYDPAALVHLLPRWWNINKCHNYQGIHRNPKGSFVGIVHLGCCKMCRRHHLQPRWLQLLDRIEGYDLAPGTGLGVVRESTFDPLQTLR
jgi:hypothetical protein